MTEEQNQTDIDTQDDSDIQEDALTLLKARADQMGIKYHPSIGEEKLQAKVNEALQDSAPATDGDEDDEGPVEGDAEEPEVDPGAETPAQARIRKKREANALVRIRMTCMDPNKREHEGEIFTVSNALVGTIRKYVPFDTEWHVPRFIYNMIKQKECQIFTTVRDDRGRKVRKGKTIKAYSVEVLEPLTETELRELAQRQAMAGGTAAA